MISTPEIMEENLQKVNQIYIKTILRGFNEFEAEDQTILLNIAEQCPQTGGDAVYKARGLLNLYIDDDDCNSTALRSQEQNSTTALSLDRKVQLYPNPVHHNFNIQIKKLTGEEQKYYLELIHSSGKIIKKQLLEDTKTVFDTSPFESGIYFCKIYQEDTIIAIEKLIIIH